MTYNVIVPDKYAFAFTGTIKIIKIPFLLLNPRNGGLKRDTNNGW
jgi:hypothetical protein